MQRGSFYLVMALALLLPSAGFGAEAPKPPAAVRSPVQIGTTLAWTGSLDSESVATVSRAGVVTLFTRTHTGWKTVELSAETGLAFQGGLKLWLLPGNPAVEQILATAKTGQAFVFQRVGDTSFTTIPRAEERNCPHSSCACGCKFCQKCPE